MTRNTLNSSRLNRPLFAAGEVLEIEAAGDTTHPRRDDAEEIKNYRIALRFVA